MTRHPTGVATYVNWIRKGLIDQGHRVSIFTFNTDDDHRSVHRIDPGKPRSIFRAAISRILGSDDSIFDTGLKIAAAINSVHQHDPVDIVEMEESFGWANAVRKTTMLPVAVRLHGPAFLTLVDEELASEFGEKKIQAEGSALLQMPIITSPSSCYLRGTLSRYRLQPSLAEHINNPVDLSPGTPLWDLMHCDREKILFVGRFDKIKGGDVMVAAFKYLLESNPNLQLLFVGPDDGLVQPDGTKLHIKDFIASLAGTTIDKNIIYMGKLPPVEIGALRATALCTVIASRRENQPYVALEAMLQGCPVVSTASPGMSELIEHGVTGLKAEAESARDLAAQVQRVVNDPEAARRLGEAARARVLDRHSPATIASKTLEVYRRAIEFHDEKAAGRRVSKH